MFLNTSGKRRRVSEHTTTFVSQSYILVIFSMMSWERSYTQGARFGDSAESLELIGKGGKIAIAVFTCSKV